MIELFIDFDEIRERVIDGIFDFAGQIASGVEEVIDAAEALYESFPDA